MVRNMKRIVLVLLLMGMSLFIMYRISFIPKKINLSYEGIMYSTEAYLAKDYDNLDIKNTTVHMRGKLYKPWFKEQTFTGYVDTDIAPVDDKAVHPAFLYRFESIPIGIQYFIRPQYTIQTVNYAVTFIYKDLSGIYLEFKEYSGHEGYSVVAPAKNIKDIDEVWQDILDIITVVAIPAEADEY